MSKTQRRRGMVAAGLAGLAIMVFAAAAGASPIRFDNPAHGEPGHYEWPNTIPEDDANWLEVTQPASSQPGALESLTGLLQWRTSDISYVRGTFAVPGGAEVENGGLQGLFLQGLDAGVLIPSGLLWDGSAIIEHHSARQEGPPEGQPSYIGMRFDPGDGWHYGWVGGVRDGLYFEAFAWGYETTPGVAIPAGAPEPGTLALLAFGAGALLRRRRA